MCKWAGARGKDGRPSAAATTTSYEDGGREDGRSSTWCPSAPTRRVQDGGECTCTMHVDEFVLVALRGCVRTAWHRASGACDDVHRVSDRVAFVPGFVSNQIPDLPFQEHVLNPNDFRFKKRFSNRRNSPFRYWLRNRTSLLSKGFRTRMDWFLPDARRDGRTSGRAAKHCFDRRAACATRICTSHLVPHAARIAVTGTCFVCERRSGSSSVSCQGLRLALAGSGSTPACPKIRPRGSLASDWWILDVQERSTMAWKIRLVSTSTHGGQAGKGSDARQDAVGRGRRRAGTMARGGWRGKDGAHASGTPADVRAHVGFSNDVSRLFCVGGAAERQVRRDVVWKGVDRRTSLNSPVTSVDPLDEHGRRYRYPRLPLPRTISPTARETEISRPSWPTMIGRGVQPPIAFLSARGG